MKKNILLFLIGSVFVLASSSLFAQDAHNHDHEDENGHNHASSQDRDAGSSIKKAFGKQQVQLKEATSEDRSVSSSPAISVDESNFKSIFTSSMQSQSHEMRDKTNGFEMEVQGRFVTIKELGLSNPSFTVNYEEGMQSLPMVQIGGGTELWQRNRFDLSAVFSGGYGFKEERLSATTKEGTKLVDIVGLHVVPLTAGLELRQGLGFLRGTSIFATPQAGMLWLRQSGSLDGMEQNRWIPFYGLRAGVVLLRPELKASVVEDHWFDGVTASWTLQNSLGTEQKLDTTSIDVGLRLLL